MADSPENVPGYTPTHPSFDPGYDPGADFSFLSPWVYLQHPWMLLQTPIALVGGAFWVWMLVHCARHDSERNLWLWILFIGNVPAAFIYFLVRWLPGARVSGSSSLFNRWTRRRQIPRLESAARNIGNAHQWVELGDACRETGQQHRAAECYRKALQKDGTHLPALWGAGQSELDRRNFAEARAHLEALLAKDPTYKFGDASLAYGRALVSLGDAATARAHFEQHLRRWAHPEAYVLLATILIEAGDPSAARERLETVINDLHGAPAFFVRQNRGWGRKARQLLRRLPAG